MCHKCLDRVTKIKNVRRSTDSSTTINPMNGNQTQLNHEPSRVADNVTISNMATLFEQMKENFMKVSNDNNELKQLIIINTASPINASKISTIDQNLTSLHAKIDQQLHLIRVITLIHPASHMDNAPSQIIENTGPATSIRNRSTSSDPLDWSFSFNQPTIPNENLELYQLLNSFESNTWTRFDHLRNKLNENTAVVHNIEEICRNININNTGNVITPVTDSIKLNHLQTIL